MGEVPLSGKPADPRLSDPSENHQSRSMRYWMKPVRFATELSRVWTCGDSAALDHRRESAALTSGRFSACSRL